MLNPRFLLFAVLALKFLSKASAMECNIDGFIYSCPIGFDDSKKFCCKLTSTSTIQKCCDANDFFKENPGILAGIIVGVLVVLIIITLCICCFCSCCCLAQRRMNRGAVIYGPATSSIRPTPSVSYQEFHPPPSQIPNPPPYYQSANPNYAYQPPANPEYKY